MGSTPNIKTTRLCALHLLRSGISVLPVTPGSKRPSVAWADFQCRRATSLEAEIWFAQESGIGVVAGEISGNLLILDFDRAGLWLEYVQACLDNDVTLPEDCAVVETPSGGHHLYLRSDAKVGGNRKLARSADGKTLIETRGEGGYALTWPTPGYVKVSGALNTVPTLPAGHVEALLAIARLFDCYAPEEATETRPAPQEREPGTELSPGEDYNARGDYEGLIEAHGWRRLHRRGSVQTWTRPGKVERECSATTGYGGTRMLYCFSTNAQPFEAERKYDPFGVYVRLEHDGDFKAATKALAAQGYGAPSLPSKSVRTGKRAVNHPPGNASASPAGSGEGVQPVEETEVPDGEMSAFEIACMWARLVENQFCYVEGGQWWRYDLNQWRYASADEAYRSIQEFLEATGKITQSRVKECLFLAQSRLGPLKMAQFNSRATWIPLANGVFDVETGELIPHSPQHFITHCSTFEYNEQAECPIWNRCLEQWMLRADGQTTCQEWIDVLQEWYGYCMIPDTRAQMAMLWNGEGSNGKGTSTRLLEALLGRSNTTPVPIEELHNEYTRAELHGKLVGFVNEPDMRAMKKNGNWFKAVVGGDPISARRPTEKVFSFVPVCRIIITTNKLPPTSDLTNGYWRRLLMIDWRYDIPQTERDADLDDKLRAELPGIFNWAVTGLHRYRARRKFVIPEESDMLMNDYKSSQDSIEQFFEQECSFDDPFCRTSARELNKAYRDTTVGRNPDSDKMLAKKLAAKGCKRVKTRVNGIQGWYWEGVGIMSQMTPKFNDDDDE